jgi:cytochrome c-type biogenesis protein
MIGAEIELGVGGLAIAFAAGIVSFISPCVLPLVPGYLSFVSGVGFDELGARPKRVTALTGTFVLGFTIMFVLLGAGTAWFGSSLLQHRRTLEIIGGAFLIVAAIVVAGLRLPRLLAMERRLHLGQGGSLTASGLAGVTFAIGWSPCIGPTLGAILTLSLGTSTGAADGAILLAAYSLGLGVPFLIAGLAFTRALGVAAWIRRHWRAVSLGSAALLAGFGGLLVSGELFRLTQQLSRFTGLQIERAYS